MAHVPVPSQKEVRLHVWHYITHGLSVCLNCQSVFLNVCLFPRWRRLWSAERKWSCFSAMPVRHFRLRVRQPKPWWDSDTFVCPYVCLSVSLYKKNPKNKWLFFYNFLLNNVNHSCRLSFFFLLITIVILTISFIYSIFLTLVMWLQSGSRLVAASCSMWLANYWKLDWTRVVMWDGVKHSQPRSIIISMFHKPVGFMFSL